MIEFAFIIAAAFFIYLVNTVFNFKLELAQINTDFRAMLKQHQEIGDIFTNAINEFAQGTELLGTLDKSTAENKILIAAHEELIKEIPLLKANQIAIIENQRLIELSFKQLLPKKTGMFQG